MPFDRHKSVRRGIRTEYLGPSRILEDHMAALEAWQRNEAVPSTAYKVGRLTVHPDLLARVAEQLEQETDRTIFGLHRKSLGSRLELEHNQEAPPLIKRFLTVCGQRFADVVKEDLRRTVPKYKPEALQEVYGGPYIHMEGNNWHRDWPVGTGLTYTLTAIGRPTIFANGNFLQSQFGGTDDDMFEGPAPEDTYTPEPGDIMVHHDRASLHRAPGEEHDGEMRVFSSISALRAFASLQNM